MDETVLKAIEAQARLWSGVAEPNAAGREMAAQLEVVMQGFEALRGTLVFEEEPSSFEAALQATKE